MAILIPSNSMGLEPRTNGNAEGVQFQSPGSPVLRRTLGKQDGEFKLNPDGVPQLVFSTKNRAPFLRDPAFRERTDAYLVGICNNQGSPPLRIGGVEDHVHILCRLSKTLDVASLIRELKRDSSKWIKEENPRLRDFQWQNGYGAFSVSPSHVDGLIEYILNQEEHHRHESFQDEFRRLCKKYGVEIDEAYVWD